MGNSVQALRALQEIDRDLYRVNEELRRLPQELARRQAGLDAVVEALQVRRKNVQEIQVRTKEIEDTITVQQQRIRKLEKESLNTRDVSVVEACRYEVRGLKRQIDESERVALGHMESIERLQAEIAQIEGRLKSEQDIFTEYSANVESELGDARGRQEDLAAKRAARMSADLDPNTLDLYDRLLVARDGEALAILDGGVCQCCFMQVPPNLQVQLARRTGIIQCSSCDRILYLS